MTIPRSVVEGVQLQGIDEIISYSILTTPWGGTPASPSAKVYLITAIGEYDDVTSTVMPAGSASVSGDTITLPLLKLLVAGQLYRVETKWTFNGNTFECYFMVQAER